MPRALFVCSKNHISGGSNLFFRIKYDMRKGQKLVCKKAVNNMLGAPLFEKGKEYEVLYIDNESAKIMVCLNHTLYANEYTPFPMEWVRKNFREI